MTLYQERSKNLWRTAFLMTGFLAMVMAVGYGASLYYNSPSILFIAFFFALVMNVYSYWFSDRQVLRMTNAHPATREKYFDFYTVAENMAITAGITMPKLYVIEDSAPNAFATGRNEKHSVVCATTGLLSMLTRAELEGVIAHEMSHIKNRDILLMTVAVVLAGFLAMLADIFLRMSIWGGGNRDSDSKGGGLLIILAIVGMVLAPIAAQLIQLAISRRREYLADASGALLTRHPEGLASALAKIDNHRTPMQTASLATAHLFIEDPFGDRKTNWVERLFATHPPTSERIKALMGQTS